MEQKLKKGDIVEKGIGIARILDINGEVATLSYMERNIPSIHTWTNKLFDLVYICSPLDLKEILIPTQFFRQIEERNVELRKLQLDNAERIQKKNAAKSRKKEKSEEEKKMDILMSKLTPSQILELINGG